MAINEITSIDVKTLPPFKRLIMTLGELPTSYLESMTYAELLMWFCNFLQEKVLPTINNNADALQEVITYLKNLDLQDEVNNKLDEMAESGQLQEIIAEYLNSKALFGFDTVADMKSATNFIDGSYAKTLGYHTINDGGGATYKIREITNNDVVDEMTILSLNNDELIAELIVENNTIHIKQCGAYGDNEHDDTTVFKNIINYLDGKYIKLYLDSGNYKLTEKIDVNWHSDNYFLSNFNKSYEIVGAGIYDSVLHFNTINGLNINPTETSNILAIKLKDFSIINDDFDCSAQAGGDRTPNDNNGIGLALRHVGYVGIVENVAISGFYIAMATRNCYGGPSIINCFTLNSVFGYSGKSDTGVQIISSNFIGIEACYHQQGGKNILTNCVMENNFKYFYPTDINNARSKFTGYGIVNTGVLTLINCYTEALFSSALKCSGEFRVISQNSSLNSFMNYNKSLYSDLATWLNANPSHIIDDFDIDCGNNANCYAEIDGGTLANTNTGRISSTFTENDGYLPNIVFNNMYSYQGNTATFERYYKGTSKPIINIATNSYAVTKNVNILPEKEIGAINTTYEVGQSQYNPYRDHEIKRKANFTNGNYNIGSLAVSIKTDGYIYLYNKFTDKDTGTVTSVNFMIIRPNGTVVFPQNT